MTHTYFATPKLKQETCIACHKLPKDPLYINVDDYQSVSKRIYPICKRCSLQKP